MNMASMSSMNLPPKPRHIASRMDDRFNGGHEMEEQCMTTITNCLNHVQKIPGCTMDVKDMDEEASQQCVTKRSLFKHMRCVLEAEETEACLAVPQLKQQPKSVMAEINAYAMCGAFAMDYNLCQNFMDTAWTDHLNSELSCVEAKAQTMMGSNEEAALCLEFLEDAREADM